MTEARKLCEFIEGQLRREDVAGKLVKLVCCHIVRGNKIGDEIRVVTVPETPGEDWIATTAEKIVEQAASEAVTLATGIQRYAVQAFYSGDDKAHGRHVFTCQGPSEDDDAIDTNSPDDIGLVSQSMRHTEFFAKLAASQHLQQLRSLQDENASLRKENADLRKDRLASFKIMEEIYGQHAERTATHRREEVKNKIFEETAEKFGILLPIAINHMAGKKVLPEVSTETLMLKTFVDSISREQLVGLERVLSPEQLAVFIRMATTISKPAADAPATDAAPAAPPNGVPSP